MDGSAVDSRVAGGDAYSVGNLRSALEDLKQKNLWIYGAAAENGRPLSEVDLRGPAVLVIGSEGKGLRQRTRECCDAIGRLDMPGAIKSLNVSNAAAISLYAVTRRLAS